MISCSAISATRRHRTLTAIFAATFALVYVPAHTTPLPNRLAELAQNSTTKMEEPSRRQNSDAPVFLDHFELRNGLDTVTTGAIASGVFSSVAFPFKSTSNIRWASIDTGPEMLVSPCAGAKGCEQRVDRVANTIQMARSQSLRQKLVTINTSVNQTIAYKSDLETYDNLDYWANPAETLQRGQGDCEDFAILKFAALKAAGVPSSSMALVILRDTRRNLYHAVLTVKTDRDIYVLDNVRDNVLSDQRLPYYQALYSLSEDRAWIHGYKRGSVFTAQGRPVSLDAVQPGAGLPQVDEPAERLIFDFG